MSRSLAAALLFAPLIATAGTPANAIKAAATKNPKAPVQAMSQTSALAGWTLGAGVIWRQIGEVSFGNGHYAGPGHLPAFQGRSVGGSGYSDGYVLPDITGSATQTWNWGYNNASQVQGNTLVFSGSSSSLTQSTSISNEDSGWSDDLDGVGVELRAETPALFQWRQFTLSAGIGYSFVRDEAAGSSEVFHAQRSTWLQESSVRDVYDITAIAPIPPAHQGNFNGPGPVIGLSPQSSSGGGSGDREKLYDDVYSSTVQQSLDIRLHTLSFGPKVSAIAGRVRIVGGLGLAVNIADYDADYEERLTVQRSNARERLLRSWQDSNSGTDVVPGFYLETAAEVLLAPQWVGYVSGRYDWAGSVDGRLGPSRFDVDLSGWTLGIGVLYRF
jgi:hypothetical protein